ncbi:MAG: sulfide/dihydroorotate dehydrogenase-like FAD/NAD-binding protein [Planctomycetota bacterium]
MYKVIERKMLVPNIHELVLEAPHVAGSIKPGNFVIVRPDEEGERTPLSIADWDAEQGTITLVFMQVGASTTKLAGLKKGDTIPTVAGPLGKETEIADYGTVVCVGGCYGIASIYPVARALKQAGNKVITVIEGRSSFLLYWQDKLKTVSDLFMTVTRDGTSGRKGHVESLPDMLALKNIRPDLIVVNGCTYQMMRVSRATRPFGWRTIVNMNPIMIDGTGMCGVCRLTVGGKVKFACVDGPDFDGHLVDWDEFLARRKTYAQEEVAPLRRSGCGCH